MRVMSRALTIALAGVLFGCPSSSQVETVPRLPGEGTDHTAKPREGAGAAAGDADPWANRSDLVPPPAPAPARALELPPIERFTLRNGLEVIVVRSEALPLFGMQLAVKAGALDAPRDKAGLAELTASMLPRGTRRRSAEEVARAVEQVGAVLSSNAGREATVASCQTLSPHRDVCLDVLSDIIVNPTFPAGALDETRSQLHSAVVRRDSSPPQLAAAHFTDLAWGAEHLRARQMTHATIDAVERKDLIDWHRTWFKPNNSVLAIAGDADMDTAALKKELERRFGRWRKGKVPARDEAGTAAPPGVRVRVVDTPRQSEAYIRLGHPGIAHADALYPDAAVLTHVLGGGSESRLMQALPTVGDQRLPAAATLEREASPGELAITTVAPVDAAVAVVGVMLNEMKRLAEDGPTDAEVAAAVADLGGSYATRFESPLDLASALLSAELHGLDDAHVAEYALRLGKVTRSSASEAASRILRPAEVVVVIAGDAGKLGPALEEAGLAFEAIDYRMPVVAWERNAAEAEPDDPAARKKGRQILARALAAKGGKKVEAIKSLDGTTEATITEGGRTQQLTFRRRYVRPDKLRHDIAGGDKTFTITIVGNQGWARHPDQGVADLPADNVAEARKQLWRDHEFILVRAGDKGVKVAYVGDETVDGTSYQVVRITGPDGAISAKLYVDAKTRMLGQMTYVEQGVPVSEVFSDYRDVEGVKIAHTRRTVTQGSEMKATLTELDLNPQLDDSLFTKPAQ